MDIKKNSNPSQPLVKKAEAIRLRDTKLSVKYIDIKLINKQTQLTVNNLYKSVDGKLVFVTCAKLGEDGKVILPDVVEKGDYVAMLCEFSDRLGDMDNDGIMNAKDAAAILKDIVEIEPGKNPLMADFNGDGRINAMDAAAILKRIVGLA